MIVYKKHLDEREYIKEKTIKKAIVLHHTAGSFRPDYVIDGWNRDRTSGGNRIRVATSYVIGGKSKNNSEFDGKIYEAFNDDYWAHHLGVRANNNLELNKQSIGIEICNFGPLSKNKNSDYYTYINTKIEKQDVIDLGKNFRGNRYWHAYTDKQIYSVEEILKNIIKKHNIDIKKGLYQFLVDNEEFVTFDKLSVLDKQKVLNNRGFLGMDMKPLKEDGVLGRNTKYAIRILKDSPKGLHKAFEVQQLALDGGEGLWSHTNYRKDKTDIYPHPQIVELLHKVF